MHTSQVLLSASLAVLASASVLPDARVVRDTTLTPVPSTAPACPAGFKNTVFNTDALQQGGGIANTWATLAAHGVSQFIAFTLYPMWNSTGYTDGKHYPPTPTVDAHQFLMIGGLARVSEAITLITNPKTAPKYLELFNEPDFHQDRLEPAEAAARLEPLFKVVRAGKTNTTLVGSPLATSNSTWSEEFYKACNGCSSLIPIQGVHSYAVDPYTAIGNVAHVHQQFPDKKIWVTEISPAVIENKACNLDADAVINWMHTVVPALAKTGYVEKVFWNRGTYKVKSNAADNCDTSLVDAQGKPRQLLLEYQKVC